MDLNQASAESIRLIREHLSYEWHFVWDRAKTRAGLCDYGKKRISLSLVLMPDMSEENFRETILHEIGHAMAGHKAGHGPTWKRMVRVIGGHPERVLHMSAPSVSAAWIGTCPNGHTTRRHRLTEKAQTRISCSLCAPYYSKEYGFTWTRAA